MAKCTYKLPEETLKRLSLAGSNIDEISKKALKAGGEIVLDQVRLNLIAVIGSNTKSKSQSTGELVSSLGLSQVLVDKNGNPNIKIGFSEPRKDGGSNAMVANVLEYGKFNQPARPFLKPAKSRSKSKCIETMKKVIEEELEKL